MKMEVWMSIVKRHWDRELQGTEGSVGFLAEVGAAAPAAVRQHQLTRSLHYFLDTPPPAALRHCPQHLQWQSLCLCLVDLVASLVLLLSPQNALLVRVCLREGEAMAVEARAKAAEVGARVALQLQQQQVVLLLLRRPMAGLGQQSR